MKSAGNSVGSVRWLIAASLVAGVIYSCKKDKGGDGGNPCPQGAVGVPTYVPTYSNGVPNSSPTFAGGGAYPTPQATFGFRLLAGPGYNDTIGPLMAQRCATSGCHVGGTSGKNADLTNYNNVKSRGATSNSRISGGSMPPSGALTATEKANFASWVSNGYPLDGSSGSVTPTASGVPTYGPQPTYPNNGVPNTSYTYAPTSPTYSGVGTNPDCLPKPAGYGTPTQAYGTPYYPNTTATLQPTYGGGGDTPVPTYGTTPTFGLLIK